ncbi:MAG: ribosome biogenesis GTP-binding protein YihA/YsxC [Bacillota bacterium]
MKIKQVELKAGAYKAGDFPGWEYPEISFLGRSNVGKSSLINKLIGKKNFARTSSTPGKTRGLYFYLINQKISFVDLPGYGYAKVSKKEKERWAPVIEEYLISRSNLFGCVHLIDCRHRPTEDDTLMAEWMRAHSVPRVTVATKADKLSRGAMLRQLKVIRSNLGLFEEETLVPFSAKSGYGKEQLWQYISALLPRS